MNTFPGAITDQLNSRDIAIIFWLGVLLAIFLREQQVRKSLQELITILLRKRVWVVFLLALLYISFMIFGLEQVGVWDISNYLKDTIVWTGGVAFVMMINVTDVMKENGFFQKAIKDSIKLTIMLEFMIGFYPFSLPVELLLVPTLAILGGMLGIASTKKEYLQVRKLLNWIITLLGILLIWHSIRSLLLDVDSFVNLERLIELLLPSILTILFLPFLYFLALFFGYETTFVRLKLQNQDSKLLRYARCRIFLQFSFNLRKLLRWSSMNRNLRINDKESVRVLVKKPIKTPRNSPKTAACSLRTYRDIAEPLMDEVRKIIKCLESESEVATDRQESLAKLQALKHEAEQIQCRTVFPLKHETLEYAMNHTIDALKYASSGHHVAASTALNRALLNQKRFDDWTVDVD